MIWRSYRGQRNTQIAHIAVSLILLTFGIWHGMHGSQAGWALALLFLLGALQSGRRVRTLARAHKLESAEGSRVE